MKARMEGWVARPKHETPKILNFFFDKPIFDTINGLWTGDCYCGAIADDICPNLKWSDEPQRVRVDVEVFTDTMAIY